MISRRKKVLLGGWEVEVGGMVQESRLLKSSFGRSALISKQANIS
jgi:hypothetical protein